MKKILKKLSVISTLIFFCPIIGAKIIYADEASGEVEQIRYVEGSPETVSFGVTSRTTVEALQPLQKKSIFLQNENNVDRTKVKKRYIITGGPSSGKTSVLQHIKAYYGQEFIPEAATEIIRMEQAEGILKPWLDINFQKKVFDLDVQNLVKTLKCSNEGFFWDRSVFEHYVYLAFRNQPLFEGIDVAVNAIKEDPSFAKVVFLMELTEVIDTNDVRHETDKEAKLLEEGFETCYSAHGFTVYRIGFKPVADRAKEIMDKVRELEAAL